MFSAKVQNVEDASLWLEASQVPYGPVELTDFGDNQLFTSPDDCWSMRADQTPVIYPNGVSTGCYITTRVANNTIYVSSGTAYQTGLRIIVAASTVVCNRTGDAGNPCIITSIVINATGVIAAHQGLKGAALSFVRGAAGGPPLLAAQEIELGQVKYTSEVAAAVSASEIYQITGIHRERYDFPGWEVYPISTRDHLITGGAIKFFAALGLTHTGNTTKHIYAYYSVPTLMQIFPASDFSPPTNTHAITSILMYEETIACWTKGMTQGSFTYYPLRGASDWIFSLQDQIVTLRFYPDPNSTRYITVQGALSIKTTYPPGDLPTVVCTITSAEGASFPQ